MTVRPSRSGPGRGWLLAVALAGTMIAAACGNDDGDVTPGDDTSAAAAASEDTPEAYCDVAGEIAGGGGAPSEELLRAARGLAPDEIDDDAFFELEAASDVAEPGDESVLTFEDLERGDYVMACFIPDPDGTPHAFLGMATTLTVE